MFHLMRKPTFWGILLISALLLAACGTASAQPTGTTAVPAQTQPPATVAPQTQPPATAPATSPGQSGQGPVVTASDTSLGTILTNSNGMTLYIFTSDSADQSTCTGGCAQTWPPLTVAQGVTPASGPGVTGTLGVFQRSDGSYQVTINGMPLYVYSQDAQPGDTNGQGLFGKWYVVDPAGSPITSTQSSTTSGGYGK